MSPTRRKSEITKSEFDKLAAAASNDRCLQGRKGRYGLEARVVLNGVLCATATPNEDGDYEYHYYL